MLERIYIGPQPGPQTAFLMSPADFALYGGAAGGGKSYGLLLEPVRHHNNPKFGGVIFRRNSVQVRNEGGLWDESVGLYGALSARPREAQLEWIFRGGMRVKFAHLENEKTVYDWQGSQIPFIGFDELTHFSEPQVTYMMSRNRSTSGVPGYIRATCNPDVESWVRDWVDWWIDEDGYPIEERSGVLRWFIKINDQMFWGNSKEDLLTRFGKEQTPRSFTFIPSKLQDNKILMQKDPNYLSNLNALSRVERMRLLYGNWNIRATAGQVFQRQWFRLVDTIPSGWLKIMRFWDRAGTRPNESNSDPDWTRGIKVYQYPDGTFLVSDMRSMRDTPGQVEKLIVATAQHDGVGCVVMSQQDPGSAGVMEAHYFIKMLQGYIVRTMVTSKDKLTRAKPVSAQAEAGNIHVLRAPWNKDFFNELENFPEGRHDDQVDTLSGAFNEMVSKGKSILDVDLKPFIGMMR